MTTPDRLTKDRAALDRVLDHRNHFDLTEAEIAAFSKMRAALMSGARATLSTKQRKQLEEVDARLKPIEADAPKRKEADIPEVLKHLPLRPPHRMHELQRRVKP